MKKQGKIAMFRYGLIVRAGEIAARRYDIPASKRTVVSVDTLLRWVIRYRQGGLGALAPQGQRDCGQSCVITPQLAQLTGLDVPPEPY